MRKLLLLLLVVLVSGLSLILILHTPALADTSFDENTDCNSVSSDQQQNCWDTQVSIYNQKIADDKNQERTLQTQLDSIDNQVKLTTTQIAETKYQIAKLNQEISDLSTRIDRISGNVDTLSQELLKRIVQTYKYSNISTVDLFFSSSSFNELLDRLKYVETIQEQDKNTLYQLQATKADYHDQKQDRETRQALEKADEVKLNNYQAQLASQKQAKQQLLTETKGNEANYETLLAKAEAQLAAFSRFTAGASLLSNQTVCDDWGCYYNQRDTQWGRLALNNTQYSIASDGCILTSMAMVYTHYGHRDVTPITINSNSSNFASYEPAYLNRTIIANGVSSTRVSSDIDSELSAGRPVIVGISYDGGPIPDHFVVLISGSNGNYQMNDPFTPDGHNIPFTSHYSIGSIKEIDKINF